MLDIKVAVTGLKIGSAFQEPGHHRLALRKTAGGFELTLPRLDVHAMVVFE